jgi:hypothetical protein
MNTRYSAMNNGETAKLFVANANPVATAPGSVIASRACYVLFVQSNRTLNLLNVTIRNMHGLELSETLDENH